MERAAWTEERLDDLAARVDRGFDRVDGDMRELRREVGARLAELNGRIDGLNQTLTRVGAGMVGTMALGFLSVIAAVLLRGG
jgi:hypothetical protein